MSGSSGAAGGPMVPMLGGVLVGLALAAAGMWASERAGVALAPAARPDGGGGGKAQDGVAVKYSFAQQGEDIIIMSLFRAMGIDKPSYLDIGAWDPVDSNNTFLAYMAGGRGVLVEPNPAYTRRLQEVRPGDVVLQAGIGFGPEEETTADYFLVEGNDQLNTFDGEHAREIAAAGKNKVTAGKAKLLNINAVIRKNLGKAPDLLSVDVEGLDLEILQTLDFTTLRPAVICVETLVQGTARQDPAITGFMADKGYELRGLTLVNSIFVDGRRGAASAPSLDAGRGH